MSALSASDWFFIVGTCYLCTAVIMFIVSMFLH